MTGNNKGLAIYASKDDVKDLATRAQSTLLLPGGKQMPINTAYALAQIALAHGLDPWNGELWPIPDGKGGFGLMVGIKGLRKSAKAEAAKDDAVYWIEHTRCEPNKYGEPDSSVVYECTLRDTHSTQAWAKSLTALRDAGVPYEDAITAIGQSPRVVGVGIANPNEKSKMGIHQRSRKRAEADAIKMRYGVEFVGANTSVDDAPPADYVNAEFVDPPFEGEPPEDPPGEDAPPEPTESNSEAEKRILNELGFG